MEGVYHVTIELLVLVLLLLTTDGGGGDDDDDGASDTRQGRDVKILGRRRAPFPHTRVAAAVGVVVIVYRLSLFIY